MCQAMRMKWLPSTNKRIHFGSWQLTVQQVEDGTAWEWYVSLSFADGSWRMEDATYATEKEAQEAALKWLEDRTRAVLFLLGYDSYYDELSEPMKTILTEAGHAPPSAIPTEAESVTPFVLEKKD